LDYSAAFQDSLMTHLNLSKYLISTLSPAQSGKIGFFSNVACMKMALGYKYLLPLLKLVANGVKSLDFFLV
jgi:hypothetical protein